MSGPDPSKTPPSKAEVLRAHPNTRFETNLAELASRFAAQSGGGLSPELSADLALEIVLNEIVEQACLATGATGAAIVLERDGEMVCRASTGATAPELGSRFDVSSGLSGECFRTQRTQWCDDALSDRRADVAASQRLGVRSVVVMPLLRETRIMGVIEIFSSQPYAFGVRDERTLEVLADRTLNNLDHARRPLDLQKPPASQVREPEHRYEEKPAARPQANPIVSPREAKAPAEPARAAKIENGRAQVGEGQEEEQEEQAARRRDSSSSNGGSHETSAANEDSSDAREARSGGDASGWMLGAAALACAILLGLVLGRHWGASGAALRLHPSTNKSAAASAQPPAKSPPASSVSPTASPAATAKPGETSIPPGGLRVLENGKEVFRMTPKAHAAPNPVGVERASSVEADGVMELSPAAAEDGLLQRVEPDYPEAAREQKIQGLVVLEVHIAADGGVQDVEVVSGPPLLAQAAIDAVKQWKFKPRTVNGTAVEMQTRVTLNFRLPK